MSFEWSGKVVLITGASSGIGRALALDLGGRGAIIGLLARREEVLKEIVAEIEKEKGRALALAADVRDEKEVRVAVERLQAEFGQVDMLIANAGVTATTAADSLQPKVVEEIIDINLMGAVNSAAAVLPEMIERREGHLVALSSLASYRGLPKSAAYCASKAALSAFFESLRIDLRGTGVDVTTIHAGFIKTPLTAGRHAQMPFLIELDDAIKKIVRAIERKRKSVAFPWQLASLVRFGMIWPDDLYDRFASRNSFRE